MAKIILGGVADLPDDAELWKFVALTRDGVRVNYGTFGDMVCITMILGKYRHGVRRLTSDEAAKVRRAAIEKRKLDDAVLAL